MYGLTLYEYFLTVSLSRTVGSQDKSETLNDKIIIGIKPLLSPGHFVSPPSTSNLVFPLHNAAQKGNFLEFKALLNLPSSNNFYFKQDFKGSDFYI